MSRPAAMGSLRRRPLPGMASQPVVVLQSTAGDAVDLSIVERPPAPKEAEAEGKAEQGKPGASASARAAARRRSQPADVAIERYPAADYATTNLVNFRIPVDLHRRFQQLVRDADARHPGLRRPSLTEFLIALLEEGPQTADEVAEMIRRKRAAEHAAEE
jgi:hypothetical protein